MESQGELAANSPWCVRIVVNKPASARSSSASAVKVVIRSGIGHSRAIAARAWFAAASLFGDATIHSATLEVPHPRMGTRAFVLVPLAQVAPQRVDPAALRAVADQPCERLPD